MQRSLTFGVGLILITALQGAGANSQSANSTELPFRLVVPGLASDVETSNPGVVAGHLSSRLDGGLVVTGEVRNETLATVAEVKVRVSARTDQGVFTAETTALVESLAAGAAAPFRAFFPTPASDPVELSAQVVSYEATDQASPVARFAFSGPLPFQIGPPDPKTMVIPYSTTLEQLRGQVTNNGSSTLTEIEVVVALYDGGGNVAWIGIGAKLQVPFERPNEEQRLGPGQTATFIVGIPIGLWNTVPGHPTLVGFLNATIK